MHTRDGPTSLPVTRVALLLSYTQQLETLGVPIDPLLRGAGIPTRLLDFPWAVVPLENAYRFGELACRAVGTEHLGVLVGLATSLDDLGAYGRILKGCITLHEHFRKGMALYNLINTGQRLWLSAHGEELRFNIATSPPGIGAYQSELSTLIVTIGKCREVAGSRWCPGEIGLAYRSSEALPDIDHFRTARILRGIGQTYFTIPRALMALPLPHPVDGSLQDDGLVLGDRALPQGLPGLVQHQIEAFLPHLSPHVDSVAESLSISTRSLQRGLAREGLSYSQVLADVRLSSAAKTLRQTGKPISEIAYDLGYTDPSNFCRAFRKRAGVSPQRFRDAARSSQVDPREALAA